MSNITLSSPPPGLSIADYTAIEEAVMETARGRWFLLEFARRQRACETQRLTESIDRLEAMMGALKPPEDACAAQTAEARTPVLSRSAGLDARRAEVAERLMEIAWGLRERGFDDGLCGDIEAQARLVQAFGVDSGRTPEQPAPHKELAVHHAPATPSEAMEEAYNDNGDKIEPAQNALYENEDINFKIRKSAMEQRIAALSRLDELPLIEKLALFC